MYAIVYTRDIELYEKVHDFVNSYRVHPEHGVFNKATKTNEFILPKI